VNDQPVFEAQYVERHSRLTTFFRLLLAIPHLIVVSVWAFVAFFAVVIAWFAIVITGRYPAGLYGFVAGFQRYVTALYGYVGLLTDEYPPFSSDTSSYPVHLTIPPARTEYSRLKTLFRIILAIPVFIISYAMQIVWEIGVLIAWFVVVVIGKLPRGLHDMIVLGQSYQQRSGCYLLLLTEDWPPFLNPGASLEGGGPTGSLPPAPTTSGAPPAPPAAPEAPGSWQPPASGSGGLSSGDPLDR